MAYAGRSTCRHLRQCAGPSRRPGLAQPPSCRGCVQIVSSALPPRTRLALRGLRCSLRARSLSDYALFWRSQFRAVAVLQMCSLSLMSNQSLQQAAGSLLCLLSFIIRPAAAEFGVSPPLVGLLECYIKVTPLWSVFESFPGR